MVLTRFDKGDRFCIDKKKVTPAEYEVFLRALRAGTIVPSSSFAGCLDHVGYDPAAGPGGDDCLDEYQPQQKATLPVTCVDCCDADACCASVGRRLCGDRRGEPLNAEDASKRGGDEWSLACSGEALPGREFPYKGAFDATTCNVQRVASAPAAVGSFVGGSTASGILDLSGNVAEWGGGGLTNGPTAPGWIRGGSFRTAVPGHATCVIPVASEPDEARAALRNCRRDDRGIRCCLD
jgi:formylglycine-generating enzyme required for sulfatase activity